MTDHNSKMSQMKEINHKPENNMPMLLRCYLNEPTLNKIKLAKLFCKVYKT